MTHVAIAHCYIFTIDSSIAFYNLCFSSTCITVELYC